MLTHLNNTPKELNRVVVIGAGGFVGGAIAEHLAREGTKTIRITRDEVDILADDAGQRLAGYLQDGDSVVATAAIAPCKTPEMLRDNIVMTNTMIQAFAQRSLSHVINIGSDAVFADVPVPLVESSQRAPTSYHGLMHLAREIIFETELKVPLATLRPTLIYGASDTHNGYGPNMFRRRANRSEKITLFGEGEERRDHVAIQDVAELVSRVLSHRSTGSLNIATGIVTSFRDVAELAVRLSSKPITITGSPRRGPVPHNGYRPFDAAATRTAFPDFRYTTLSDGMAVAQRTEFANG